MPFSPPPPDFGESDGCVVGVSGRLPFANRRECMQPDLEAGSLALRSENGGCSKNHGTVILSATGLWSDADIAGSTCVVDTGATLVRNPSNVASG